MSKILGVLVMLSVGAYIGVYLGIVAVFAMTEPLLAEKPVYGDIELNNEGLPLQGSLYQLQEAGGL